MNHLKLWWKKFEEWAMKPPRKSLEEELKEIEKEEQQVSSNFGIALYRAIKRSPIIRKIIYFFVTVIVVLVFTAFVLPGLFGAVFNLIAVGTIAYIIYRLLGFLIVKPTKSFFYSMETAGELKKSYSKQESLIKQGEFNSAIQSYKEELLADKNNYEIYIRIGDIYQENIKDYFNAIKEYRKALSINNIPEKDQLHIIIQIARMYEKLEKPKKALAEYKKILQIDPNSESAIVAKKAIEEIEQLNN